MKEKRILIIGGGAAGYFGAITAAEQNSDYKIVIAEAGNRPLQKVEISGGGRCNVTQACFEIDKLIEAYPRGQRELRGSLSRFQPRDTIEWFQKRGVKLKTESDGRMFPVTDSSKTIIDCFEKAREEAGIELLLKTKVTKIKVLDDNSFRATLRRDGRASLEVFDTVLITTGAAKTGYQIAKDLGHTIEPLVPSLFTFEIKDSRLEGLEGLSVETAEIKLKLAKGKPLSQSGPLLITHWGLSGPAVIKLSAWGARPLFKSNYQAKISVNWCAKQSKDCFLKALKTFAKEHPKKKVVNQPAAELPKRLWASLCKAADISESLNFSELSKQLSIKLADEIFQGSYQVSGKGVFKEEFVTCGGVRLKEIDFRKMESKLVPGLYFAGEVLDIDGITGGYNFQSAWTGGHIAGSSI